MAQTAAATHHGRQDAPYLSIQGVSMSFGKVRAIEGISLIVQRHEIIALIGANGAGKTSILRAVTGLHPIGRGEIWFDGRRIDGMPAHRIARLGISMVPEGRRVFPYMSVRDNLLMGAFQHRDPRMIRESLDRCCAIFPRLGERMHQAAGTLSGGEQQMVAIGRALMSRPKLLLLDEPSLGIAPQLVREIGRAILAINRDDGVTVILVEQNSRMALKLSHRGYVLETGSIRLEGPSDQLMENDEVRKAYLGG